MKSTAPRLLCALLAALLVSPGPLAAGDVEVDGSFVSTVATGTPPLAVTSTTRVDNLNADLLDGLDGSALARSLDNVVRVGQASGDFTSIQAALDSITTASAVNPFLVLVGPGVYTERVAMKPFVDVQGSGEGVTTIAQAGSASPDLGTVAGADDAELRFLTVVNSGGTGGVIGIYNEGVSPRILQVTVEVATSAATLATGIWNEGAVGVPSTPYLQRVTVRVDGTGDAMGTLGVLNQTEANALLSHVRVDVSGTTDTVKYGIFNSGASPTLHDVEVTAGSSEPSASVFGVVNQDTDGAILRSVRVAVTGGGTRYGVNNTRSDLTIRDLDVDVSGDGSVSYGVFDEEGTVTLESCSVEASGGTSVTAGVFKADASGEILDCTVTATGGTGFEAALQGFDSTGGTAPQTVDVQHSRLAGTDLAISAPDAYTVRVGASQLDGGVGGGAPYTCVYAYDGAFAALTTACVAPAP